MDKDLRHFMKQHAERMEFERQQLEHQSQLRKVLSVVPESHEHLVDPVTCNPATLGL
jgi:hypothetical protein